MKVFVFGDLIIDSYITGNVSRIAPEGPFPVLQVDSKFSRLGGAANVAANCSSLGLDTHLCGFSNSSYETHAAFLRLLSNANITSTLIESGWRIPTKTRLLSNGSFIARYDDEKIHTDSDRYTNKVRVCLESCSPDLIIVSDYAKGSLTQCLFGSLLDYANKHDIPLITDPKPRLKGVDYSGSYLMTPNKPEAEALLGSEIDDTNLETALIQLKSKYNLKVGLVTLGKNGIAAFTDTEGLIVSQTKASDVFDVTGAGDTVIASIAYSILHGAPLQQVLQFANQTASEVVGTIGTYVPTLKNHLKDSCEEEDKGTTSAVYRSLVAKVIAERQSGKSIVFTNGCFDILHAGHIDYLRKAKELGDILVVGINSDDSIRRLKGLSRPINCLEHRRMLLESLRFVDHVIPFQEDTPLRLLSELKPYILVKGGDYLLKDIVGREYAQKTLTIPVERQVSTSLIYDKLVSE